jgi:hypothetical protein
VRTGSANFSRSGALGQSKKNVKDQHEDRELNEIYFEWSVLTGFP